MLNTETLVPVAPAKARQFGTADWGLRSGRRCPANADFEPASAWKVACLFARFREFARSRKFLVIIFLGSRWLTTSDRIALFASEDVVSRRKPCSKSWGQRTVRWYLSGSNRDVEDIAELQYLLPLGTLDQPPSFGFGRRTPVESRCREVSRAPRSTWHQARELSGLYPWVDRARKRPRQSA